MAGLPRFTEREGHSKIEPLRRVGPTPEPFVIRFLERRRMDLGLERSQMRILDIGCGRGDRVSWLLSEGWDAYGADVVPAYLDQGREFVASLGGDGDRLRLIDGPALPFDDVSPFHAVISDQVLEHVEDLDAFVAGVARVGGSGAVGLHIFPARWRLIEAHMKTPLVHWLPKGPARRAALKGALKVGFAAEYFAQRPLDERTEIFGTFSETETFYRSDRELRSTFGRHGIACAFHDPTVEKLRLRLPQAPTLAIPAAAFLYRRFWAAYMTTVQH